MRPHEGAGGGRLYTLTVRDDAGNVLLAVPLAVVPHDQGKR